MTTHRRKAADAEIHLCVRGISMPATWMQLLQRITLPAAVHRVGEQDVGAAEGFERLRGAGYADAELVEEKGRHVTVTDPDGEYVEVYPAPE